MDFENNYNNNDFNQDFITQLQKTESNLEFGHMTDSAIETKLFHVRRVTKMLIEKAKCIEEKRKFLETTNMHLKNENADLAKRYIQSHDEIKMLNSKLEELKVEMASVRHITKVSDQRQDKVTDCFKKTKSDKAVSCRILPAAEVRTTSVTSTQTCALFPPQDRPLQTVSSMLEGFPGAQPEKSEMILSSSRASEPVIMVTKKELRRLDKNMESLRMKLEMKEDAWTKIAERERDQRLKLLRCRNEMMSLTKLAQCRSHELAVTTKDLRMARAQLDNAEKEIKYLKKVILKTRTPSNTATSPQPSWSMAIIKQIHDADETASESKKKKPKSAKKVRKTKTKFENVASTLEEIETYMFLSESSADHRRDSMDDEPCVSVRPFTASKMSINQRETTPERLQKVRSAMSVKSFDVL